MDDPNVEWVAAEHSIRKYFKLDRLVKHMRIPDLGGSKRRGGSPAGCQGLSLRTEPAFPPVHIDLTLSYQALHGRW